MQAKNQCSEKESVKVPQTQMVPTQPEQAPLPGMTATFPLVGQLSVMVGMSFFTPSV
jgi:hypothetical protein